MHWPKTHSRPALRSAGRRHGASGSGQLRSAPSKLNCPVAVPATPLTLTAVRKADPPYAGGAHATVVADVQPVVPHASVAVIDAVGVKLELPKLRPLIVTDPPEVRTPFGGLLMLALGAGTPNVYACCKFGFREAG